MLLNSLILLVVIFTANIYIIGIVFLFYISKFILKNGVKELRSLKLYLPILLFSFFIQLIYNRSGKVLLKQWIVLITETGMMLACVTVLKISAMVLISKESEFSHLLNGPLKKYRLIFRSCMRLVPEIMKMPKNITKPGSSLKIILRKSYKVVKENYHTNASK